MRQGEPIHWVTYNPAHIFHPSEAPYSNGIKFTIANVCLVSVGPPQGETPIGIMVCNRTTTRAEKLEMGEAMVECWLSSPNQPPNLQPVSQGKELPKDNK